MRKLREESRKKTSNMMNIILFNRFMKFSYSVDLKLDQNSHLITEQQGQKLHILGAYGTVKYLIGASQLISMK